MAKVKQKIVDKDAITFGNCVLERDIHFSCKISGLGIKLNDIKVTKFFRQSDIYKNSNTFNVCLVHIIAKQFSHISIMLI